ncbi:MAG: hypothetical protein IKA54_04885 [Clostridia bacterium]|jgi:hypothetical protein|nr:hypothetical protein [Clostridia bacterium]
MNKAGETEQTAVDNNQINTSHTAEAEGVLGDGSKEFGRFSTASELLSAYNSLESEFTRRCQKLKELERENERLVGVEQSIKNSAKKDFQGGKVFKERYPETNEIISSLYEIAAKSGDEAEGFLERAYVNYLKGEIENQKSYYSSNGYLLETAGKNQAVKDEIIREYLMGVSDSKPTVGRFKGNGEGLVTPPSKPKTLSDANRIANIIFEKAKEIK